MRHPTYRFITQRLTRCQLCVFARFNRLFSLAHGVNRQQQMAFGEIQCRRDETIPAQFIARSNIMRLQFDGVLEKLKHLR